MDEVFETLQRFPEMGVERRQSGAGVRVLAVDRRWKVVYRLTDAGAVRRVVDAHLPLPPVRS